jgi:type VI secretion system secreted protein Hcp
MMDMFLKLDGIDGESTDSKHKNQIDLLAWSWGLTQSGTAHQGLGSGGGKVSVADISFDKYVDKATPNLMKFCCNGKYIKSANLYVRKAGGDTQVEYFKMKIEDVLVTSYHTGGDKDKLDRMVEHISLNFSKYVAEYTPQNADQTAGSPIPQGWSVAANDTYSGSTA